MILDRQRDLAFIESVLRTLGTNRDGVQSKLDRLLRESNVLGYALMATGAQMDKLVGWVEEAKRNGELVKKVSGLGINDWRNMSQCYGGSDQMLYAVFQILATQRLTEAEFDTGRPEIRHIPRADRRWMDCQVVRLGDTTVRLQFRA